MDQVVVHRGGSLVRGGIVYPTTGTISSGGGGGGGGGGGVVACGQIICLAHQTAFSYGKSKWEGQKNVLYIMNFYFHILSIFNHSSKIILTLNMVIILSYLHTLYFYL